MQHSVDLVRHTDYDALAATFDRRYKANDYAGIERALTEFLAGASARALEAGCGTGHWLRGGLYGVDLSRAMLLRVPSRHKVAQARVEALPFAAQTFDRLFAINAHHHFSDKRRFLREAHRVLSPGGSMMTIALDPHTGTDQWWIYDYFPGTREIDTERYPSCEQLRAWMREAGFVDVHTREVQHLPGDIAAREALDNGTVSPEHTSQLAVLTEDEFDAGLSRIQRALEADSTVHLSADLRVYATYGTRLD